MSDNGDYGAHPSAGWGSAMSDGEGTVRIAMWSGPRNISTAMMRAWENRNDTAVWDEPLYAHYLAATGIDHPGRLDIVAALETDWRRVVAAIMGPVPGGRRIFYQKHMTHHLLPGIDRGWLAGLANCFLIRDPGRVLASYARARDRAEVTLEDLGLVQQVEIFDRLRGGGGAVPPVLDAADLLADPRRMLRLLCEALGIEFSERMLAWPPGRRDSDGMWGEHWYAGVWESTGFKPQRRPAGPLPDDLELLRQACMPYYRHLHGHRLV